MRNNKYEAFKYLGIGLEITVTVLLGAFAGYYIDKSKGTAPFGTAAGALLGIIFGFYILLKQLGIFNKK